MTRPLVFSNGSMNVGVNLYGMVHDFYYPYVGLENHAAANDMRWRIGVWVEGDFSWLDDGKWNFLMDYEDSSMVGVTRAHNKEMGVILEIHDCVDFEVNAFERNFHVINDSDREREIRLFLHQVMCIGNNKNADTLQYLPLEKAILSYKGSRAFVFGATDSNNKPFEHYSIGMYKAEGKKGTYTDAEDGVLKEKNVEHGSVDSVIGFNLKISAHDSDRVNYWVSAGLNSSEAVDVFRRVKNEGVQSRMHRTAEYWKDWLRPAEKFIDSIDKDWQNAFRKNMLIVKSHIDKRGSLIASSDTTKLNYSREAYSYSWPRDAVFSLWPLLRLGYFEEVKNFLIFCKKTLHPDGYLMHKYQADGALGSSWHPYLKEGGITPPIQEDETAIVVFLLGQYYQLTEDKGFLYDMYESFVRPTGNFMAGYIDESTKLPHATYELWEEKHLTTTYTTAVTYAALLAAAHLAEVMDRKEDAIRWQRVAQDMKTAAQDYFFCKEKQFFYKGFIRKQQEDGTSKTVYDDTVDISSFYGAFMFGLYDLDSKEVKASYETLNNMFNLEISSEDAVPLPRYVGDLYDAVVDDGYGNPWVVATLWLAQYYIETGKSSEAKKIIGWMKDRMLDTGVLPEQFNPRNNNFISVAPLAWSQAEFLNTVIDLNSDPMKDIESAEAK